jgi:hypothetical protein
VCAARVCLRRRSSVCAHAFARLRVRARARLGVNALVRAGVRPCLRRSAPACVRAVRRRGSVCSDPPVLDIACDRPIYSGCNGPFLARPPAAFHAAATLSARRCPTKGARPCVLHCAHACDRGRRRRCASSAPQSARARQRQRHSRPARTLQGCA